MTDYLGNILFAYNNVAMQRGLGTINHEDTEVTFSLQKARGSRDNWHTEIKILFYKHKRTWRMYGYGSSRSEACSLLQYRARAYFLNRTNDSPDEWYDCAWSEGLGMPSR